MDVEFLIERLEHYILEESPKLFGVRAVNEDEVRAHLTQLRAAIPDAVMQAREIVTERDGVLTAAHQEAQQIIAAARTKAEQMVTEHRLVQEARHLALDERKSLSSLVSELLESRVRAKKEQAPKAPDLSESLLLPEEPEWFAKSGFPLLNREVVPLRATPFRFERDPDE